MMSRPSGAIRCGTLTGHTTHYRRGEKPCEARRAARTAYDERYRADPKHAQNEAYKRLAHLYPELYRRFYQEAKRELESESNQP